MSNSNLYDILGVSRNAPEQDIRRAYKKLAKEHHPDKNPGSDEKFKEISFAHEVLTNPKKREVYDRYGIKGLQEGLSDGESMFHTEDIFSHFFGNNLFGMGTNPRRRRQKGEDTHHNLKVTLEDLYNGKLVKLELSRDVICSACNGNGGKAESCHTCPECKGYGVKLTYRELGPGMMQQLQRFCNDCGGEGTIINERDRCKPCAGKKVIKQKKMIEVQIDKGMKNGQKIYFHCEGDQSPGVEPGDVIIVLSLIPHEIFEVNGNNLYMVHTLSLTEALCGFAIPLKHLDGRQLIIRKKPEEVIVPGSLKGIKGEGMPVYRDPFTKGDLYIKFKVEFPDSYFTSEEKLLQLEKIFPSRSAKEQFDLNDEMVEEVGLHEIVHNDKVNGNSVIGDMYEQDDGNVQCVTH